MRAGTAIAVQKGSLKFLLKGVDPSLAPGFGAKNMRLASSISFRIGSDHVSVVDAKSGSSFLILNADAVVLCGEVS